MTWNVKELWRHPIKGIGAETLDNVALSAGKPVPLDRAWAILEAGGDASPGWRSCRNFLRGAKGPSLMAVQAKTTGDAITLTHPDRPALTLPLSEDGQAALFEWLGPIYPEERQKPVALVPAPEEGLADVPFASVSILSLASLRALSQKAGRDLDTRRFRSNIWLDGLAPWEEFDLVGQTLCAGKARLHVVEPITRCRATEANPKTGHRDTNILRLLEDGWGHSDFGVYAKVTTSGEICLGDDARIV